jgi:uncharacterized protein (DUF58 family)
VELEVENESPVWTSFLLLEDRIPRPLGRAARLVVAGIPPRGKQRATYTLAPEVRGRYSLGPLTVDVSDPFALTKLRIGFDQRDDLVVTPEIERLEAGPASPFGGASGLSLARHLFRTGEEFYTMRQYQEGDDLRRIHWPSVARSNQLMIRQDESTRRSTGVIFLDTREPAVGSSHTPCFEKCVSAAASIGALLSRYGFSIRLATSNMPPTTVTEDQMLEALAGVGDLGRPPPVAVGRGGRHDAGRRDRPATTDRAHLAGSLGRRVRTQARRPGVSEGPPRSAARSAGPAGGSGVVGPFVVVQIRMGGPRPPAYGKAS